ncbi:MAG TPA: anti-sigma factor antagonist [Mycobacteriales bacterium]|nr:anti-sigma factor antagonist [Mycobacteriales bacterium]
MTPDSLMTGSVEMEDGPLVVTLGGEIDIATTTQFQGLMERALSMGAARVVVDLAGVSFLDGRGLDVLLRAAEQLRGQGSRLELRAVPPQVYWLFEVTGLVTALGVERPPASTALSRGLADVAALPLARQVLDTALQLVVTMAQTVIAGADGVSITLPRDGSLCTVAASNDVVLQMDGDQYDTGQGPCLDAATQGERFHSDSLDGELRWPAFITRARARGIRSIMSTPLVAANRPIGALNIYSRMPEAFEEHEQEWADQFAGQASTVVASAYVGAPTDLLEQQIQQALASREVIALAQGIVMHREGVAAYGAHKALRDVSRRSGVPMRDVCADLVDSIGGTSVPGEPADGSARGPRAR